jgi:hypothetical protein
MHQVRIHSNISNRLKFIHTMTLPSSSRSLTRRPLTVKVHLLSWHIVTSLGRAALSRAPSAETTSFASDRIFSCSIVRFRSSSRPRALVRISRSQALLLVCMISQEML